MTDPSPAEHWALVEHWLRYARSHVREPDEAAQAALLQFDQYLSCNQHEQALDALVAAAGPAAQNHFFWDCLYQAAKLMQLEARAKEFAGQWAALRVPKRSGG